VTGAAVRLGRTIALALAERGFALGLHYHQSAAEAEALAAELNASGCPALLLPGDLSLPADVERIFRQVAQSGYPLRVLVNSAAVMPPGRLSELAVEDWDAILALNLRAPWLCATRAAALMESGVIVNLSDAGAGKPWTGFGAYVISKAGVETLTRLLAKELAPRVRVNAVAPGLVLKSSEVSDETWDRLVQRLPLRQATSAEDVARAVVFLVETESITGQILAVDGGYQLV
jgi:NAD(P)-dependent dehydrogenase (short-subunit alcohol dehydrogenase family)